MTYDLEILLGQLRNMGVVIHETATILPVRGWDSEACDYMERRWLLIAKDRPASKKMNRETDYLLGWGEHQ